MGPSDLHADNNSDQLDQYRGDIDQQFEVNTQPFAVARASFQQRALDSAVSGQGISAPAVAFLPVDRPTIDIRKQVSRGNQAKRFAEHFDNVDIKHYSALQLALMRELSFLTDSHKALERTLKILKARYRTSMEYLVFDEAQEMQPRIFEEGMLYREKLLEFYRATDGFDKAVSNEVISDDFFDLSRVLRWRREAQQVILETQHGAVLLEQAEASSKDVAQFVAQYENALAASDTLFCLRLEANPIFGLYPDGFKNIEARFEVAKYNGSIVRAKQQGSDLDYYASLLREYPGFSREDFDHIFSAYGSYYEEALDTLQNLYELADNLRTLGLPQASEDLLDLHLQFAKIDGSPLGTPSQRVAFYNKMLGLSPLEYQWYSKRPHFGQGGSVLKDFTNSFISTELIPNLIDAPNFLVENFGLELHRWLTKGSSAQLDVLLDREYGVDISGIYRTNKVRLEDYIPPPPDRVPGLMSLFDKKIQEFSLELTRRKSTMSPLDYEDAIIQIALYIQEIYVDIHPMRDGNGRVSRALCEAYIRKFLGDTNAYAAIPVTRDSQGEARVHADLVSFNFRWSVANRSSQLDHVNFDTVLVKATLDSILHNELLIEYRAVFKGLTKQ